MARPLLLNDDMITVLYANVALGLSNKDSAINSGVSPRTFREWLKRGESEYNRLEANTRARPRLKEALYLSLYEAIREAEPKRKQAMIGRMQELAQGGQVIRETRKVYRRLQVIGGPDDGKWAHTLVEEVVTEKETAPVWQIYAWFLERKYPEYRKQKPGQPDWTDEILQLLYSGDVTHAEVYDEIGHDLALEFYDKTGVNLLEDGKAEEEGPEEEGQAQKDTTRALG